MLGLSAETGLANNGVLQGLVVILVSGAVTGLATYLLLRSRFEAASGAHTSTSIPGSTPDHLDEVLTNRAASMGLRLPVERSGAKPVKVRFSDGSEEFYFERDLERYDLYILGAITPLDRSTINDPPKMISEWTRREKVQWLANHPLKLDKSDALEAKAG